MTNGVKKHIAFLGLGSNLGDRKGLIEGALSRLDQCEQVKVIACSGLYETRPAFVEEQPDFLNGCAKVETTLSAHELMDLLLATERELGRVRTIANGPRTIDLDLLFYDRAVIDEPRLKVPHLDLHNRLFVLAPLSELAMEFIHPLLEVSVGELYSQLLKREEERGGDET